MDSVKRSRVLMVAAALVFLFEGGSVEAFVMPSGLATQRNLLPGTGGASEEDQSQHSRVVWKPLRSFQFIKGETSYGDLSEGSTSGMISGSFGGNSLSRGGMQQGRRSLRNSRASWWSALSGFSRTTPTTLLAAGSLESFPVMEADDVQIMVGADTESPASSTSQKNVKATLERWERDISLEVVGYEDNNGYSMLGNEMQPNGRYDNGDSNSDRCTQSIKFDVANGDVYPFSGTISVPPPLTVEDSMGNKQSVMMVLNNPDENDGDGMLDYDEYGNELPPSKPSSIEAKLEPLYKSPDQKYAEAQEQQQLQYDEYGNEIYNPQDQTTTIPSQGYQSFQLDATDPATGKIKISLERDEGGGGGFGGVFGGGNGGSSSEARVEIYHGFRDQYGNSYNDNNYGNDDEEDRRISLEVSTMHPTFSSVVDTMPANLLAKHALSSINDLSSAEPYLEVRIVNTGGAALKAGVKSFSPQYRPQTQQQRNRQNYERQKYGQRQQFIEQPSSPIGASAMKADDPFLLVDSAQSTTSARRMNTNNVNSRQQEAAYVRPRSASRSSAFGSSNFGRGGPSINTMWSTGDQPDPRRQPSNGYGGSFGTNGGGMRPDTPGADLNFVRANAVNRVPSIQSRVNPAYWDAIDTTATGGNGRTTSGLVANNDFTKANGSADSAIIPGSRKNAAVGGGYRRVSASSTFLQSFGGNSGDASGMQQPFQRQQQRRSDYQQSQSSFGGGNSVGGGLQVAFPDQTSVQRTRTLQGRPQQPRQTSVYAGNGNVVGNGVIAGRPASTTSAFRDNRMDGNGSYNNEFGSGSSSGFQAARSNTGYATGSFTPPPSNAFGGENSNILGNEAKSNNFLGSMKQLVQGSDSFTTQSSFGGRPNGNNNNNSRNNNSSFRGNNNNNNRFGNNNDNSFGGNNNGFGNASSSNNNNFQNGGGGSPFGKLGAPPQTMANSKNPFANLNGETRQGGGGGNFQNNSNNNNFGNSNNNNSGPFGGAGGGGAPQRPLSPSPNAMKNPFAGLNREKTAGPGGSTTAMRSSSTNTVNGIGDYNGSASNNNEDNPIVGFAKNLVQGIGGYGTNNNNNNNNYQNDDDYYDYDAEYYR